MNLVDEIESENISDLIELDKNGLYEKSVVIESGREYLNF